jgi:Helicase associated domain
MWSSTQSLTWKRIISPVDSLFLKSFRRISQNGRPWRRLSSSTAHVLPPIQYFMGQQYACPPQRARRILFSNTALSISTEEILNEEKHEYPEPEAVTSISRRRRPLRISSVTNTNIGEQRLYSSPGSVSERKWNSNVKKFRIFVMRKFQRTKGHVPRPIQPKDYPKNSSLRTWLRRVRIEYQKKLRGQPSRLTEQRIEQLRQLGFQFIETVYCNTWETVFQQLCTYIREHDGRYPHETDFATLSKQDMKLYLWCIRQRVNYKIYLSQQDQYTCLNEKRIEALNGINFVWCVLESQWDERYEELKQFNKEHGTTLVPATYVGNYSLARWVSTQRRQYALLQSNKPSNLTDERIQLLNQLGFVWDPFEVRWMERYNQVVEFQRQNGQFEMPTNASNPSLRRWVLFQRKQFHKWMNGESSTMTARRKELLDQLGMDWTPSPARKSSEK